MNYAVSDFSLLLYFLQPSPFVKIPSTTD